MVLQYQQPSELHLLCLDHWNANVPALLLGFAFALVRFGTCRDLCRHSGNTHGSAICGAGIGGTNTKPDCDTIGSTDTATKLVSDISTVAQAVPGHDGSANFARYGCGTHSVSTSRGL